MRVLRQAAFAALLTAACLLIGPASQAAAAGEPYGYDPLFSLIGNCSTTAVDPVPDPGCPGGAHPPSNNFKRPAGVGIDAYGNEYVAVQGNESGTEGRIDIFDDQGNFISEMADPFGPQSVAIDKLGTLYVYEGGVGTSYNEVARYYPVNYAPEVGQIDYSPGSRQVIASSSGFNGSVAIDWSTDRLFLNLFSVQEYASVEELASPEEKNPLLNTLPEPFAGVHIAVDAQRRRLFVSYCKHEDSECVALVYGAAPPYPFIAEIDGSSTPAGAFSSQRGWLSIAVDEETGHIFVEDLRPPAHQIYEFGPSFEYLSTIDKAFLQTPFYSQAAVSNSPLNPDAANRHHLFAPVSSLTGVQEVFAFAPSAICPPKIEGAAASHLSETEGELRATIEPCGADTSYTFTLEEEGSEETTVVGEGTIPGESQPTPASIPFTGLRPGTPYRFTVTATNEKGTAEEEESFSTYADAPIPTGVCPNEDLRTGASSSLPDCRAFELVTAPDTNGRPMKGGGYAIFYPFTAQKASPNGNAITFVTEGGALPGTNGSGSLGGDRYRAVRGESGWSTAQFGPTATDAETAHASGASPDQGYGFWDAEGEGTAVIGGAKTNYLQFPDGHSELIGVGTLGSDPRAEGMLITENAGHVIFQTQGFSGSAVQLEPDAPPAGTAAVYDRTPDGITHVVSLLPGDLALQAGEHAFYVGASHDGAGIAFEVAGKLYLRGNNAATYEVGEGVAFAGLAEGGSRIYYVEGGDLFAFEAEGEETIEFTKTGNAVVVNVAPDGRRAYFISTTAISGAGENPNGARPKGGQRNLYLSEEGQIKFVGVVTKRDVEGEVISGEGMVDGLGLWVSAAEAGRAAAKDPSRVNPTGSVLLFQSRAPLDGHDSGGTAQIYRYDSQGDRLQCISCNPTRTVEGGGASLETFGGEIVSRPPIGTRVLIQNITPDGGRVVFESKEALLSTDNDAVQDVYEWERSGLGSCERPQGCVYLLSSGHTSEDNYLYGMSRSADDVFFVTGDVLIGGDNDTASIYDARVGGGFPPPSEDVCLGEDCRPGPASPPLLSSPASPALGAEDNLRPRRCPIGRHKVKRRGKVRCVKKRRSHHKGARRTTRTRQVAR
jgi:hypothetical protein